MPGVQKIRGCLSRRQFSVFDRLGAEIAETDITAIEEQLHEEHENSVVLGHVPADIVDAIVAFIEHLNADLLPAESLNRLDVADALVRDGAGLSFDFLVLSLGERGQTRPKWNSDEDGEHEAESDQSVFPRVCEHDHVNADNCECALKEHGHIRGQTCLHDLGVRSQTTY